MYISFDVGGTFVKYGVLNLEGEILEAGKYLTNCKDKNIFMQNIKEVVNKYIKRYEVKGIAFAMPGIINPKTGYMKEAGAIFSLYEENIKDMMRKVTDLPVEVENDANCVALAEKFNGNATEIHDFVCMTIGTGIGGGIILNNRVHHGWKYTGGEFGHMRIGIDSPESLHDTCSTRGLINMYKEYKGIREEKIVDGKEVFDESLKDSKVQIIVDKWFRNISIALYNIAVVLAPQKILIGGGISERNDFLENIETHLKENQNWINIGCEIGVCKHKNNAGMIGALYHFFNFRR